jgi:very-short-patch-repair endonuclease
MLGYNKNLKALSQHLRKNMTEAEKLVWSKIRGRQLNGFQFYRQKVIGAYIVDFYCPKASLVVELDGGQHFDIEGKKKDKARDDNLAGLGLKVLRFSNKEVFSNHRGVIEEIWKNL